MQINNNIAIFLLMKIQIIIKKNIQHNKIGKPIPNKPIGNQSFAPIKGVKQLIKYTAAVIAESR